MSTARFQEALLSASNANATSYHVFLSFRGEDTRKTFTEKLYTALVQAGIHTFKDDNGIERGENIKSELQKAIHHSRISVVVFSRNYATSGWCLDELVLILKRYKTSGHVILPVFYHVEPTLCTKPMGSVAEAIARHEERILEQEEEKREELMGRVKGWKDALREVAEMGGMILKQSADNRYEHRFIRKVVEVMGDKLCRTAMNGVPQLIGMKYRTKDLMSWLQDGSNDVGIYVVCGMGGVGKTTIAKFVYNLNVKSFESGSFLANVGDISRERNGMVRLQKQLLGDIVKRSHVKISSVGEGIKKIKDALSHKKVLVVMDDVDHVNQVNDILGMQEWFHSGSKIIITTRNDGLINPDEVHKVYKVENLDRYESLEQFSWHAFGQEKPFEDFLELSRNIVRLCEGLPLALQVLGSSLSGKSLEVWESLLKKLEVIPDYDILKKLRLSYDCLQDAHDKSLFLHIACFFTGVYKDKVVTILDECDFFTIIGIQNLINRSMLTIDDRNKLVMHQVLRDMGRGIVRNESPKVPGRRSRIWHHKDGFNVLREKTGTETVQGIILDMHLFAEHKSLTRTYIVKDAEKDYSEDHLDNSLDQSISVKRCDFGLFSWKPVRGTLSDSNYFETNAFGTMQNLILLKLNKVHLSGSYKELSKNLRWLFWRGCPLKYIPSDFPLENIVAIDMRYSSLKQAFKRSRFLGSLKLLDLSHSQELSRTPDFTGLPKLEKLILKNCPRLVEIHESIGELNCIVYLDLKDCRGLMTLPRSIGRLRTLEKLDISGCSNLKWLPEELRMLHSLKVLQANGIALGGIHFAPERVQPWIFARVSKPRKSYESLWTFLPHTISNLSLANCNLSGDVFPLAFSNLSKLQNLDISGNPIHSLPDSFKGLTELQSLNMENCTKLTSLTGLPTITELFIDHCTSLEKITYQSAPSNLPIIKHAFDNNSLVMLQGVYKLERIEYIDKQTLEHFGLDLESIKDIEVKVEIYTSEKKRKLPLQGLYERGIFSIFLPGNKIPSWFTKISGSSVAFTISSDFKVKGLSLASFYASAEGEKFSSAYWRSNRVIIHNKTKDLKWIHKPTIFGCPEDNMGMTWLSHWKFGNLLEGGDEITILVQLNYRVRVMEVGIFLVCDELESRATSDHDIANEDTFFYHDFVPGDVAQRGEVYKLPQWAGLA